MMNELKDSMKIKQLFHIRNKTVEPDYEFIKDIELDVKKSKNLMIFLSKEGLTMFTQDEIEQLFINEEERLLENSRWIRKRGLNDIIDIFETSFNEKGITVEHVDEIRVNDDFFSKFRINEIQNLKNTSFDLTKIIRILEEVNTCYANECYLATSTLLRMLIDHIPPFFGKKNFKILVAEYSFSQSDRRNMQHLLGSLKNISDGSLHNHISKKETLLNKSSIEFRADFDVLLKNIITHCVKT